jgi:DNA-binding beta-propeller fold protein YncE
MQSLILNTTRISALVMLTSLLCGSAQGREGPLERVQVIPLKGPPGKLDHQAVDSVHSRLFVANTANGSLDVIDLKAVKLLRQIPGQTGIQGIAYSADRDRIYVGNGGGGISNVFDGRDYQLLKSIPLGEDADNVRYDPRSNLIYVAHADEELSIYGSDDYALHPPIKLSKPLGAFQLESKRPRLYANTKSSNQVAVIDTTKSEVIERFSITRAQNNSALAIDEGNHRLFVGCRKPAKLVILDSDTGQEIADAPLAGDVDDLYYDAKRKRLYASCGEGFLIVIRQENPDRYEAESRIATASLARTSRFDPGSGRLYLVVPRQPEREGPEVWVYEAQP